MTRLGSGRDYKTRDIAARAALNWHLNRMNELVAGGMNKDKASEKAFTEWLNLPAVEVKRLQKEVRDRLNRR